MENLSKNITIDAMEAYNKAKKPAAKTSTFDAKNYLNLKLDTKNGELSREVKIRLLPIDANSNSPFKIIKMHNIAVPKEIAESGFKSYVCLSQVDDIDHEKFGNKCPFCEKNREEYNRSVELMKSADIADEEVKAGIMAQVKEIQKKSCGYLPNDVGIIRCIERGKENEGPKFWKFNIRQDKKDPYNTILELYNERLRESREENFDTGELNILDLYRGKDLKITINAVLDSGTGKPTNKTSLSIIDYGQIKPISNDQEQINRWVSDTKVWSDVFVVKTYDYLSILINGGTPWFDSKTQTWVAKSDFKNKSYNKDNVEKTADNVNKILNNLENGYSQTQNMVVEDTFTNTQPQPTNVSYYSKKEELPF